MPETKERIVSYRRAYWVNQVGTLESYVKRATQKLMTPVERTVERAEGQLMTIGEIREDGIHGLYVHLVADTPGELASVVSDLINSEAVLDVSTTPPPAGTDFLDGDAFIYIRDDDVCFCSTALRDGVIRAFLQALFRKANLRNDAGRFELLKIASRDKLKMINQQGVREIEIRASMYAATSRYHHRTSEPIGLLDSFTRQFRALFGKEHDVTDDALTVNISVKIDRRVRKHMKLGEKRIEFVAKELIKHQQDDDDFVIITETGEKITASQIYLRGEASIKAIGKTVDKEDAWKAVKKYYIELEQSGALET